MIENQSKRDFSTYLKILGGIGAYISAICFIGFFGAFGFFDDKFTRILNNQSNIQIKNDENLKEIIENIDKDNNWFRFSTSILWCNTHRSKT